EDNISDIIKYVTNKDDQEHRYNDLTANPASPDNPEMWMLSTSVRSAETAARQGTGYTFGLFPYASEDKTEIGREAIRVYRENFRPSAVMREPTVMVAPFVVAADTEEEADELARALDLWLLGKDNFSEFDRMPSVETAENYHYTETDIKNIQSNRTRMVVGDKESVAAQLSSITETFGADELLLIPLIPGAENRHRALEAIASQFKNTESRIRMKKLANYLWVEKNVEEYTLIMTPELQDDVGTVGFVEFTENKTVAKDDSLLELEGSKTVLDLTSPLAGEIVAIN